MQLLSLIAIIMGIILFVVCAFRGVNLLLAALLSSVLIMALSRMPILDTTNDLWMVTFSGFLKSFFLIFILSSLFGKTLADGKASRSMAVAFSKVIYKSEKNRKLFAVLFVPIMYTILSYAGVSGFVIVFTVMAMSRDLFQEFDVPWRFYAYGAPLNVATTILGGSLQLTNIMLSNMFDTGMAAGMGLSVVGAIVFCAVTFLLCKLDLRKAEHTGEGFMDTGAAMKNDAIGQNVEEEKLPHVALAFLPMASVILIAAIFNQVLIALVVGIIMNFLLFSRYMPSIKGTLGEGITSGFAPVINVAAASALSSIIAQAPGFGLVINVYDAMPALYGGIFLIALITFLTATPTASYPAFGEMIFGNMVASGISAQASHRIMAAATFPCLGPHSPGVVNAAMITKIEFKKAAWIYTKVSIVSGLAAIIAMVICINLGIFV